MMWVLQPAVWVWSLFSAYVLADFWALMVFTLSLFLFMHWLTLPSGYPYDPLESSYIDPKTKLRIPFPSIDDEATIRTSLVIPAYNEAKRIRVCLDEAIELMEARLKADRQNTYEIIIVSDGSRDATSEIGLEYSARWGSDKVRVLSLQRNRGKGGAVKKGVLHSRGEYILFLDADGATEFASITKLEAALAALNHPRSVAVGSRAHLQDDVVAERSFFRNLLMYGFHVLVSTLCVRGVRDTQCGFKMFTRRAARTCFYSQHLPRWAFDVELLYVAQATGMPIAEVPVNWQEVDGSTLDPLTASIQMARDLVRIRFMYLTRLWTITES